MTTILKRGIKAILSLFYNNHNTSIHLREISRQTKLEGQSIVRYLNSLEKEKILFSKKEGNQKKYNLRNNDIVYSLLSLFDIEKYNKLPFIKKQAIEYFLNNIDEQPIIAFLFGSTAKGTYRNDSDIDILLIVNKKINTSNGGKIAQAQTNQIINDFQINYKNFIDELKLKNDKVIQAAIETGFPLTNHIIYYRCIKNEEI
jgi:predicted nucleotidyltransferase